MSRFFLELLGWSVLQDASCPFACLLLWIAKNRPNLLFGFLRFHHFRVIKLTFQLQESILLRCCIFMEDFKKKENKGSIF